MQFTFPCWNSEFPILKSLFHSSNLYSCTLSYCNLHFLHFKFQSFNFLFFKIQYLLLSCSLIYCNSPLSLYIPSNLASVKYNPLNQNLIRLTKSPTKLKLLNPSIPVGSTSLPWVFYYLIRPGTLAGEFCVGLLSTHQVLVPLPGIEIDWQWLSEVEI